MQQSCTRDWCFYTIAKSVSNDDILIHKKRTLSWVLHESLVTGKKWTFPQPCPPLQFLLWLLHAPCFLRLQTRHHLGACRGWTQRNAFPYFWYWTPVAPRKYPHKVTLTYIAHHTHQWTLWPSWCSTLVTSSNVPMQFWCNDELHEHHVCDNGFLDYVGLVFNGLWAWIEGHIGMECNLINRPVVGLDFILTETRVVFRKVKDQNNFILFDLLRAFREHSLLPTLRNSFNGSFKVSVFNCNSVL